MKYKNLAFAFAITAFSLPALNNVARAETPAPAAAPAEVPPPEVTGQDKQLDMFRFTLRMDKLDFVKQAMALNAEQEKQFLSQY